MKDIEERPNSPISVVYQQAIACKLPFVKHYMMLHEEFSDADDCLSYHTDVEKRARENRITRKANDDPGSILGTYSSFNTNLISPPFYRTYLCREYEREMLTKYRTGGHRLRIRTGRFENVDRDQRLCKCGVNVQTLHHVVFDCALTEGIRTTNFAATNLSEFFEDLSNAAEKLRMMETLLDIR